MGILLSDRSPKTHALCPVSKISYIGLGGVENGQMVEVGWVWVLHMHYAQSSKVVNVHVSQGPAQGMHA